MADQTPEILRTAQAVAWYVRVRLRTTRQARGLTLGAAARASGLAKSQLQALENAAARNLYLHQLVALANSYELPLTRLFAIQWTTVPEPAPPGLDARHIDATTRRNLRVARQRSGLGTPEAAARAWGRRRAQSTIVRWETGQYRYMDVARLHALSAVYGLAIEDLLFADLENP